MVVMPMMSATTPIAIPNMVARLGRPFARYARIPRRIDVRASKTPSALAAELIAKTNAPIPANIDQTPRVLLDFEEYRALKEAASAQAKSFAQRQKEFNETYKDWIAEQHRIVEEFGVFGEEYRVW